MLQRVCTLVLFCVLWLPAAAPRPKEVLGFEPGDDYKLANYTELVRYFQKLAASTDRMRLVEYGKTSMGKPSYMAFFSSAENLRQLDKYKEINRKLALGLVAGAAEAKSLAKEGKVFVWIDSGLHATEVAPSQHAPELAYRMVTDDSDELRQIRDKVVLIQIPCINPDGLDMVVEWYRKNVGSPYELAPLPGLYQKYAGHDNNRDWYMMNLQETRNVSKLLFEEWFPQIVYNQHQAPAFPARIFVPPYAEPLNPNIPAPVMEGINLIGAAMKERFARENKPGILSYFGFDAWWNGGLRSVPAFHNMHGILTETALHGYGTPRVYKATDFPERFGNGMPTKQPTVFYERPWMGGKWGTREAMEYMLTADMAILDLASTRSEAFLTKAWQMARDNIEAGKKSTPYAYVIPQDQWDKSSAVEMLRRLQMGGVTVHRATSSFTAGGQKHAAGTYVLLASQPFRGYLVDLMEAQKYPELRAGTTGPTKRPYDVAGWTLPMQMGVKVQRADDMFQASLEAAAAIEPSAPAWDFRDTASFRTVAEALSKSESVRRSADGRFLRQSESDYRRAKWQLSAPRVGLYMSWSPNIDAGWTQFLLDEFRVNNTVLRNEDIRKGNLRARFDAIVLPDQSMETILHGWHEGQQIGGGPNAAAAQQRPEYTGGIGLQGAAALEAFVREGGTLLAFDDASDLPVQLFGLPVRSALAAAGGAADDGADAAAGGAYYSPGSILRVQVDNSQPVALGMPADTFAFQSGGKAWDIRLLADFNKGERAIASVARYASRDLLASGWLSGEKRVAGKSLLIDARYGQGRVVLFGFRPQFRGQSWATFRLVLNALYLSAARTL